jgi:uncharacterized membrane protein YbhN (UPF0104 family)
MLTHSKTKNSTSHWLQSWRAIAGVLFLGVAVYILAGHWHTVSTSLHVARTAKASWLLVAIGFMVVTMLIAASIYGVLAINRLRYFQTVLVEVAAGFVNRILPSGLGSLGLHGVYLFRKKHTVAEATAVVSTNNLLGVVAHLLLLLLLFIARPNVVHALQFKIGFSQPGWAAGALVCACAGVLLLPAVRPRLGRLIQNVLVSLRKVGMRSVIRALVLASLLTTTYTTILFCSAHSVGIHISGLEIFVVFTAGMFSGTIVPLPGGLVGAEAGLLAGFIAYNVPTTQAGAAVLIFRLVTYWLPIIPGILALLLARRRQLV